MKRIPSVALGRHLLVIAGLALASTVGSLSAADTYYVSDHLATTTAVADAAGEIASLEADAFGSPVSGGEQAARYTGKPYDADIGAYVFPFRNYRSEEGRWISADPSGFPDKLNNRYYAPNVLTQLDPTGLTVYVYSHSALFSSGSSSGGGGGGPQHSFLVIYPDNPGDFSGTAMQTDASGNQYFTLGGGPSGGNLVSDINRPTESLTHAQTLVGQVSDGTADTAFINELLAADGAYGDDLDYDALPSLQNGYNSNSYIAGLLRMTGAPVPSGLNPSHFPGFSTPVPNTHFE